MADSFGIIGRVERATSSHSSAMTSATAPAIAGSVSARTTLRTERERASLRMRLAMTSTAKPHQATSAGLGDWGKPTMPYRFQRSCASSQEPQAAAQSP